MRINDYCYTNDNNTLQTILLHSNQCELERKKNQESSKIQFNLINGMQK